MFLPDLRRTIAYRCDKIFNLKHFFQPIKRQHTNKYLMLVISLVEKIVEDLNFHRTGLTLLRRKARKNLNGLSLKSRPPNNF